MELELVFKGGTFQKGHIVFSKIMHTGIKENFTTQGRTFTL